MTVNAGENSITLDQNMASVRRATYLRAVRAFGQLVPNSNLRSWLFVIMRNAWLNQLRHARSGPHFEEFDAEGVELESQR
ncbi:MAG: hypothetical protein H0U60_14455 [Blastocatellia bacterium]|nr:hypothetical protein [Blastocatellia bacterium]